MAKAMTTPADGNPFARTKNRSSPVGSLSNANAPVESVVTARPSPRKTMVAADNGLLTDLSTITPRKRPEPGCAKAELADVATAPSATEMGNGKLIQNVRMD